MHPVFRALASVLLLSAACAAQHPSFDVASIRPSPPGTRNKGMELLSPFTGGAPKGGLFSANAPLSVYIIFAYHITDSSQYRPLFASLPAWAQSGTYDIEARIDGTPDTDQVRAMVRSLLEERFKLATHLDTRPQPVYALVFDKPGHPGPQLHPHPVSSACTERPVGTSPAAIPTSAPAATCGTALYQHDGRLHVRMIDESIEQAAISIGGAAGFMGGMESRSVVNQTGLTGQFDLDIEFAPETPAGPGAPVESTGPTFEDALKSQLGLKLVKQTGTVSTLVVDHIEKPSEN
ncbi:soil-associated protein, TIGR03435 family [Granulicella pectinivorans]|uniref:Soil-associated protein, TIGR03435 family n=1 Tax=Granulicella pectinivorans TaxID=474950 RepID=A0A1I6LXM1_9BACT|nr:TIGR03435 family protein [Granulicella pectinivorans]SFS08042.1 soil-associated protein, TIGR03435 family [Granulicella pectinivorans]